MASLWFGSIIGPLSLSRSVDLTNAPSRPHFCVWRNSHLSQNVVSNTSCYQKLLFSLERGNQSAWWGGGEGLPFILLWNSCAAFRQFLKGYHVCRHRRPLNLQRPRRPPRGFQRWNGPLFSNVVFLFNMQKTSFSFQQNVTWGPYIDILTLVITIFRNIELWCLCEFLIFSMSTNSPRPRTWIRKVGRANSAWDVVTHERISQCYFWRCFLSCQ